MTATGFADYAEYYEISKEEFDDFSSNLDNALDLLGRCRKRTEDKQLLVKPGKIRGNPC